MENELEMLKGVPAGAYLEWLLKKRGIPKSRLAMEVGEYPQTLVAIIKGKRKFNTVLALRIEKKLGLQEGFLMTLQVFYEIKEENLRTQEKPDISKFGKSLFWDTDVHQIDWQKNKRFVIERVTERGDDEEKAEIARFYGEDVIQKVLGNHAQ